MVEIFCDGACSVSKRTGGFGVVALKNNLVWYAYNNSATDTTNNREEIKALLTALRYTEEKLKKENVTIYSDSAYVVNMFNDWIFKWAANGWRKADKKPIENLDLVMELWEYAGNKDFQFYDVKHCDGHSGVLGNEMADALATNNITRFRALLNKANMKIQNFDFEYSLGV